MADAVTTDISPSQSTLSANFAPYVYDMLARGQAAASQPFQEYTGERFAGPSALQQQAFQGIAGLQLPGQFQTATDFLTQAGQQAGQFKYQPMQVSAPSLQQYQMNAPQQVGTQGFSTAAAQGLMSPYMQNVVDVQQQQAQRQADIANQAQKAQFARAGAFGGGRSAIAGAQAAADLARQKQNIQAAGLQSAYQQAQQQFNTQQQAALQAALANQQAGITTGAQNLAAQLGVQQLGAGQNLQAQQINQAAQQAGAGLGLQALQQQLGAGQALGNLGLGQYGAGLQGLQALLGAGATQQQFAQQPLDFGYQQYQQSLQYPYQQATFMQSLLGGLPLQAPAYNTGQTGLAAALQGGLSGLALYNLFNKP